MKPGIVATSLLVALLLPVLVTGCSNEDADAPAAASQAATETPQPQAGGPQGTSATTAFDAQIADIQAALKAREYEKSAEALLTLQSARLNEQQAAATAAQMRQLQSSLAAAVASGDPAAKAAADRLRRSAMRQ